MPRDRHGWIGYERNQRSFASVCACGWLSDWFTNPALAGSAIDDHLSPERRTGDGSDARPCRIHRRFEG